MNALIETMVIYKDIFSKLNIIGKIMLLPILILGFPVIFLMALCFKNDA